MPSGPETEPSGCPASPDLTSRRIELAVEKQLQLKEEEEEEGHWGDEEDVDNDGEEVQVESVELFAEDSCDLPGLMVAEEEPEVQPLAASEPPPEDQPLAGEEVLEELAPPLAPTSASAASAERRLETLMAMLQRETEMHIALEGGSNGSDEQGNEQSRRMRARTVAGEQWQYMAPAPSGEGWVVGFWKAGARMLPRPHLACSMPSLPMCTV